jgi:hypothetical protein
LANNQFNYGALGSGLTAQSINTISLSSLNSAQGMAGLSLSDNDIMTLRSLNNPYVKRYQVAETSEDILALSVAWRRIRNNSNLTGVSSLLDESLFNQVTEEDRVTANSIRDYFSKKVMMWSLKDIKLTKFRQDMSDLIHADGKKVNEAYLPIAYKLPEFYDYDIEFDNFKQKVKLEVRDFDELVRRPNTTTKKTLTPIKSLYRSNKRSKQHEYWFKDVYDTAHLIIIEPKNPLMHIWDKLFEKGDMQIEGLYSLKQADDLQYYKVLRWSLI